MPYINYLLRIHFTDRSRICKSTAFSFSNSLESHKKKPLIKIN